VDLGLTGRGFVVGGGSRGLGRAVASELVAEGARVVLVARDADSLAEAAGELGDAAVPCPADLAEPGAGERISTAVHEHLGDELHGILVNHGGPPFGRALDLSDEEWQAAFDLVLRGPLALLRALVPTLAEGGSIVFVTSSTTRQPMPGLDTSNVLRPGIAALVKTLAHQLAPRVRVNGVAPGRIATDRSRALSEARASEAGVSIDEQLRSESADIPMARLGEPAELARVATFLLSPAASYVTGANLQVDGGYVTAVP
jgi:3-oxoacyl-[acyl-carrier protein] reductase